MSGNTFAVAYLYALGVITNYTTLRYIVIKDRLDVFTGVASKAAMAVSWPISVLMFLVIGLTQIADDRWGK